MANGVNTVQEELSKLLSNLQNELEVKTQSKKCQSDNLAYVSIKTVQEKVSELESRLKNDLQIVIKANESEPDNLADVPIKTVQEEINKLEARLKEELGIRKIANFFPSGTKFEKCEPESEMESEMDNLAVAATKMELQKKRDDLEDQIRISAKKFNELLVETNKFNKILNFVKEFRSKLSEEYGQDNLEKLDEGKLSYDRNMVHASLEFFKQCITHLNKFISYGDHYLYCLIEMQRDYRKFNSVPTDAKILNLSNMLEKKISSIQDLELALTETKVTFNQEEKLLKEELQGYRYSSIDKQSNLSKVDSITSTFELELEAVDSMALIEGQLRLIECGNGEISALTEFTKKEISDYYHSGETNRCSIM